MPDYTIKWPLEISAENTGYTTINETTLKEVAIFNLKNIETYDPKDFYISKSNFNVSTLIKSPQDWFNRSAVIFGQKKSGKTHLLNAAGFELKKKKKVMFIPAERFMYQFIKSITVSYIDVSSLETLIGLM